MENNKDVDTRVAPSVPVPSAGSTAQSAHGSSRHTPGPWEIEPNRNAELCIYGEQGDFWIALLPHQCVGSIEDQQKVNACLIVAAPDLLKIARDVAAFFRTVSWDDCNIEGHATDLDVRLEAAIAKAEGR